MNMKWMMLMAGLLLGLLPAEAITSENPQMVRLEADYIRACQYIRSGNSASGAINDIFGAPTWVVPRENALAILGLLRAHEVLGDSIYRTRADDAMKYLIRVQPGDGGWFDQYSYTTPVQFSKSPTQTAEVMIAMNKLGYQKGRYTAMTKAAEFLIRLQNPANKTGLDDGLVGAGLNPQGGYYTWRWVSDNAFAYQAFKAAAKWARLKGDQTRETRYETAAARVLNGINTILKDPASPVWHAVVDAQGVPVPGRALEWINYAPQMLDVPAAGVGSPAVGDWIQEHLVHPVEGGVVWNNGTENNVLSPGYSFQACLVWLDLGQHSYADSALAWVEDSGLHQLVPDGNGVTGCWVDWTEAGVTAPWWERFVDTSFYFIAVDTGGYDFTP